MNASCALHLEYFSCVPGKACHSRNEALEFWEVLSCGNAEKELTAFFQALPVFALVCVRITHVARAAGSLQTNPVTLNVPGSPQNPQSCSSSSIFQAPLAPSPSRIPPVPLISQNLLGSSWLPFGHRQVPLKLLWLPSIPSGSP